MRHPVKKPQVREGAEADGEGEEGARGAGPEAGLDEWGCPETTPTQQAQGGALE
jgi:hypothetical protein